MAANWPRFWSTPFKYMRWAAGEYPALFYPTIIGTLGPIALVTLTPLRRRFLYEDKPLIPKTYPSELPKLQRYLCPTRMLTIIVPTGERVIPEGYADDAGE
jgi:hypothetical protein